MEDHGRGIVTQSTQPCGCDPGWGVEGYECAEFPKCDYGRSVVKPMSEIIDDIAKREDAAWGVLPGIKDSGERVIYSSGAMRDPSTGKIKWSRITFGPMMRRWAQHLTTAEAKYPDVAPGVPNFSLIKTDEELRRYKESAFRHFMSWYWDHTDEDHAAAVFFNINGVEIIKDKKAGRDIDGISYVKEEV